MQLRNTDSEDVVLAKNAPLPNSNPTLAFSRGKLQQNIQMVGSFWSKMDLSHRKVNVYYNPTSLGIQVTYEPLLQDAPVPQIH
jgi:hypothetical protein